MCVCCCCCGISFGRKFGGGVGLFVVVLRVVRFFGCGCVLVVGGRGCCI